MITMMMNNNAYISILPIYPRAYRRAHISPEEDWEIASKNCSKLGYFCITKIRLGEISFRKKVQIIL